MQSPCRTATIGLLAALFAHSPAFAQGHRLAACKSDIDKLCASEPKGHGKVRACLEANKDKLAPECKAALEGGSQ
jgi:hypothetical protein